MYVRRPRSDCPDSHSSIKGRRNQRQHMCPGHRVVFAFQSVRYSENRSDCSKAYQPQQRAGRRAHDRARRPFSAAGVEHSSQRAAPGRRLGDPAQLDFGLNALLSKRSGALQAALGHSASARSPPHFERTRQGNNIDTIRLETISAAMFHKDALPDWMRNEATGQLDCVI